LRATTTARHDEQRAARRGDQPAGHAAGEGAAQEAPAACADHEQVEAAGVLCQLCCGFADQADRAHRGGDLASKLREPPLDHHCPSRGERLAVGLARRGIVDVRDLERRRVTAAGVGQVARDLEGRIGGLVAVVGDADVRELRLTALPGRDGEHCRARVEQPPRDLDGIGGS
jgi:hypothetical protein